MIETYPTRRHRDAAIAARRARAAAFGSLARRLFRPTEKLDDL